MESNMEKARQMTQQEAQSAQRLKQKEGAHERKYGMRQEIPDFPLMKKGYKMNAKEKAAQGYMVAIAGGQQVPIPKPVQKSTTAKKPRKR
jgi:hypothetical protein